MNSSCEKMRNLIVDHVLGLLGSGDMAALNEHLEQCTECEKFARALQDEKLLLRQYGEELDYGMAARQGRLMTALEQHAGKQQPVFSIWRKIMQNNVTKYIAAALIIIAVIVGIGLPDASPAWAQVAREMQVTYNQYHEDLLLAVKQKDFKKASDNANALSEFWQSINRVARGRLDDADSYSPGESLAIIRLTIAKNNHDDTDKEILNSYAEKFLNWFGRIEDEAWIYEVIHISKEMEEYAEEIRDAWRSDKSDMEYAEHNLRGFIVCCEWFGKLPWDDPVRAMSSDVILKAIERDLEICRMELETARRADVINVVNRCVRHIKRNATSLEKVAASEGLKDKSANVQKLKRTIAELSETVYYWIMESGRICAALHRDPNRDPRLDPRDIDKQVLRREFKDSESLAAYLLKRIYAALSTCEQMQQLCSIMSD